MGREGQFAEFPPPARIFVQVTAAPGPLTPWTYNGPLGSPVAMPELAIDFTTTPCEPRNVVWDVTVPVVFTTGSFPFRVTIRKQDAPVNPFGTGDIYEIQLEIDGVPSFEPVPYFQQSALSYTEYVQSSGPTDWFWPDDIAPVQVVNRAAFFPCAWDRVEPGPPWVRA